MRVGPTDAPAIHGVPALAANSLTHINWAFALFQPTDGGWEIVFTADEPNDTDTLIAEFVELKVENPSLDRFLSIGGWSFNNGATAKYWSQMASTKDGRVSFTISSSMGLMVFRSTFVPAGTNSPSPPAIGIFATSMFLRI